MKQNFTFLWSFLILISLGDAIGQDRGGNRFSNQFVYDADLYSVKKVTFHKPNIGIFSSPNWLVIKSDFSATTNLSGDNSSVAWENGEKKIPIGYVSGIKARVEAEFDIVCSGGNSAVYYAKASNSDGYNLPAKILSFTLGKYRYLPEFIEKTFPAQQVQYWEDFQLDWQISTSPNGPWLDAGSSKNYMYVTHKIPKVGLQPSGHAEIISLQHTFLHIGCKNAQGLTTESTIVNAIYTEFTDREVRRFDGEGPIQYWGTNNLFSPQCWQPSQMLILLNGTCGGWAAFFDVILHIQGIDNAEYASVEWTGTELEPHIENILDDDLESFLGVERYLVTKIIWANGKTRSFFFVKDWSPFSPSEFVLSSDYYNPFQGTFSLINGNTILPKDLIGVAGQGNDNPRAEFENHAIVKYNGLYYDPSYGSNVSHSLEWENYSIDGLGALLLYDNGIDVVYINWISDLNELGIQKLTINP